LGASSLAFWYFSPASEKFSVVPLVFLLGSLTLVAKGVFLFRKTSEGLGLSDQGLATLSDLANRKALPTLPEQAAQILQDFGAGPLLLWPLLNFGQDIHKSWNDPPRITVFVVGAGLFLLGWALRKLATPQSS